MFGKMVLVLNLSIRSSFTRYLLYIKNAAYIYTFYAGDDKERLKVKINV